MTIAKADLISFLNSRLERGETNIDSLLRETLLDLSLRVPALADTEDVSLAEGDKSKPLPTGFRDLIAITMDGKPLGRINSFENYLELIKNETESNYSKPTKFIIHGGNIYFYHTSDDDYTATIYQSKITTDTNTIQLDDRFENALKYGLCFFYLLGIGQETSSQGQSFFNLYVNNLQMIDAIKNQNERPKTVNYYDV